MDTFRIWKMDDRGSQLPGYFVGSTAALNVDDEPDRVRKQLEGVVAAQSGMQDARLADLVQDLSAAEDPELVIFVHGYNNPSDVALKNTLSLYHGSCTGSGTDHGYSVRNDRELQRRGVFVGFRWPSSHALSGPFRGVLRAMPELGLWLVLIASFGILGATLLRDWTTADYGWHRPALGLLLAALALLMLPVSVAVLRLSAYFRDNYRATHYGVPDLVEFITHLDLALRECESFPEDRKVRLSFIGHSMGAYVVTGALRVLSQVFEESAIGSVSLAETETKNPTRELGCRLELRHLILVSPDIPAEAIMLGRANFLASALRRCEEAVLFSNQGDMVLRLISTAANYFSFPAASSRYGMRLGNVGVRGKYGVSRPAGSLMESLTLGKSTLAELNAALQARSAVRFGQQASAAAKFHYFDCTDYEDGGKRRLCWGTGTANNPLGRAVLLVAYALDRVDVHSGYFHEESVVTRRLICRCAFLGRARASAVEPDPPGNPAATPDERLDDSCRGHGVRALH